MASCHTHWFLEFSVSSHLARLLDEPLGLHSYSFCPSPSHMEWWHQSLNTAAFVPMQGPSGELLYNRCTLVHLFLHKYTSILISNPSIFFFITVGRGCTMIQESRSLGSFHGLNEHFLYIQFGGGSVKRSWISYSVPSGQPWNHHHVIMQGEHSHCWNLSTTQAFMCENLIPSVRCYKGGWNHWKAHGIIHH